MNVNGQHFRTIWQHPTNDSVVQIIDQRHLPHQFIIEDLNNVWETVKAISEMHVRGAGLIGATAAYGMYLAGLEACQSDSFYPFMRRAREALLLSRPTAVNLEWAVKQQWEIVETQESPEEKTKRLLQKAQEIADQDAEACRMIGMHGVNIIEEISRKKKGEAVQILTHCNAGWLAFVDYGSALAPVYAAYDLGIKVHVWVDETRPRNQGARLTAWELGQHKVPHTVIADNTGGHLMQHGKVDLAIVGSDRTTRTGDVANKIGTYLKALAAKDNEVPFYVALPSSSIDWNLRNGLQEIPIENRGETEVKYIQGLHDNTIKKVLLTPESSAATNYAFDVTPSRLVTGLITERGVCNADEADILRLFPEENLR